jgi:hypothetical protein
MNIDDFFKRLDACKTNKEADDLKVRDNNAMLLGIEKTDFEAYLDSSFMYVRSSNQGNNKVTKYDFIPGSIVLQIVSPTFFNTTKFGLDETSEGREISQRQLELYQTAVQFHPYQIKRVMNIDGLVEPGLVTMARVYALIGRYAIDNNISVCYPHVSPVISG